MTITVQLTGTPDQLREFLHRGIFYTALPISFEEARTLAGEALERAVSHGATGLILGDRCRLDNAARALHVEVAGTCN